MSRGRHTGGLMLVAGLLAKGVACGSSRPSPSGLPVQVAPPGPAENRAAMDECMAAAGYVVHPGSSGSNGVYSWERLSYYTWQGGDRHETTRRPKPVEPSSPPLGN